MKSFLYVYNKELAEKLIQEGYFLMSKQESLNWKTYWVFALDKLPMSMTEYSAADYLITNKMFF